MRERDRFMPRSAWLILVAGLLAVLWYYLPARDGGPTGQTSEPRIVTPRGDLAADEKSTIELFEKSKNSVVFITTQQQVMDLWTRNVFSVPRGTGSGFIWDDGGHVVTNYHVVQGAAAARVKLADGRDYKAALVGASPQHDLAVLKVGIGDKHPLPLPIGDSASLKTGQKVFAIGNPFGLDWTLTTGIVSALDRSIGAENGAQIEHLIQTDAAINPGNSGGPLLDSAGRLIGITTAIFSPSGASAGIGFAVPVDTINRVVPQLIRHGKYLRPSLGIEVDADINSRLTAALNVKGVVVLMVARGSAAEAAGLKGVTFTPDGSVAPGDIIVGIEGKSIDSVGQVSARLDDFKIGDTVRLTVLRGREKVDLSAVLQPGA